MLLTASFVALLLCAQESANQTGASDEEQFVRSLAEGYQNNRETFRSFRIRSRSSFGYASSAEGALRQLENEVSSDDTWIQDEESVLFIRECGIASTARNPSSCMGRLYLSDGQFSFNVEYDVDDAYAGGTIRAPQSPTTRVHLVSRTPFDMGIMGFGEQESPYQCILRGLDIPGWEYQGERELRGIRVAVIKAPAKPGGSRTFFVAPDFGFLAIRIELHLPDERGAGLISTADVYKMWQCPNGAWIPQETVTDIFANKPDESRRFHVVRLINVDVEKPDANLFELSIDKRTMVTCPDPGRWQFWLQPTTITIKDLPHLYERALIKKGGAEQAASPTKHQWLTFLAIQLVVILLVISFTLLRSLRQAKGHDAKTFPAKLGNLSNPKVFIDP